MPFAILIQFATFELGATIAYLVARPEDDHRRHRAGQPDLFPSVPRMFEKIYTLATANVRGQGRAAQGRRGGREGALAARRRRARAGASWRRLSTQAEEQLFKNVRGLFGQNIRECVTGAAPIASRSSSSSTPAACR